MPEAEGKEKSGENANGNREQRRSKRIGYRFKSNARLSGPAQLEFLHLISQGCTPLFACHQLERTMEALQKSLEGSQRFRREYEELQLLMNQRVESAVYKAALKGNVSAQTLWLKHRSPEGWNQGDKGMEEMTDDELLRLAKREGIDPAKELTEGTGLSGGESESEGVSEPPGD